MTLRVRALGDGEADKVARMARSRTLGAGLVRRAQIVRHAVEEGLSAPEIAARMDLCGATVRFWLKRFNERGLQGLEEDMRSGRPPTYTAEERSAVITAALSRPTELGLPCGFRRRRPPIPISSRPPFQSDGGQARSSSQVDFAHVMVRQSGSSRGA